MREAAREARARAKVAAAQARAAAREAKKEAKRAAKVQAKLTKRAEVEAEHNRLLTEWREQERERKRVEQERVLEALRVEREREHAIAHAARKAARAKEAQAMRVAEEHLEKAERGDADAMHAYAKCLQNGDGVGKSEDQSLVWFMKSAQLGNAKAQCAVGFFHYQVNDRESAKKQFKLAAAQGHPRAMCNLGQCYKDEKDLVRAAVWFTRARDTRDPGVFTEANLATDVIRGRLTTDQLQEMRTILYR